MGSFQNNGDGTYTVTDNEGDSVTLPLNTDATISEGAAGTLEVDLDGDGTTDVTVPSDRSIVDNAPDDTVTITTNDGSVFTIPKGTQAIITDDGTTTSLDTDGDGTADVTAPSGSTMVSDGDEVVTTLAGGEQITTDVNSGAVITDNGGNSVTVTNSDGSEIAVDLTGDGTTDAIISSGMTVADAGGGNIIVTDADNDSVILPANSDATVSEGTAGTLEVDLDNDGTADVTVANGSSVVDNGDGTQTITDPNGDSVTIPINSNATVTGGANGQISVDLDGDGTTDITVPSGSSIANNASDGTLTVTTTDGSTVTLPDDTGANIIENNGQIIVDIDGDGTPEITAPSGSTIVDQADGTIGIDIDGNGTMDVTINEDDNVTVTDNNDGTISIDTDGDGTPNATINNNENAHITTNPDDSVNIDFGGDGIDAVIPQGSTAINNDDGTVTVNTENGEVQISANQNIAISDNPDGTINFDVGNDGIVDIIGDAHTQVVVDNDVINVTTPNGIAVSVPANERVAIQDDPATGLAIIYFGYNGVYDVKVPDGSTITTAGQSLLIVQTLSGDTINVQKDSQSDITVPAVNVYLDRSVIAVQPNAQGEYRIGGGNIDNATVNIADRSTPVDFSAAFSGFAKNTVITLNQETFASGSGTIEAPFSAEFQGGTKATIASLLSSDNVEARITGVTPEQGQIETVLNGNKIDIIFVANPTFSGQVDMVLDVHQNGVLVDKHHFTLKVIQTPDVLSSDNNAANNTRITSNVNVEAKASAVAKIAETEILSSKPIEIEQTAVKVNFKAAVDQGQRVEVLTEIASNTIKESLLDTASTQDNTQEMVKQIVRDAVAAQQNEVIKLQDVGKIAAGMVNGALDVSSNTQFVVKGVVEQTIASGYNAAEVAEVLTQMILETDESERIDVVRSIANETQLSPEHIEQVFNYLQAQNPALAEVFAQELQSSSVNANPQDASNHINPFEKDKKQGLLATGLSHLN